MGEQMSGKERRRGFVYLNTNGGWEAGVGWAGR